MARSNLLQKLETFGVVSLITALIWLYAEGRNVTDYANEPVPVQFVPADDSGLTVLPDQPQRVLVSFQGSSATRQALDDLLADGPILIPMAEEPDAPVPRPVVLRDKLNDSALAEIGIRITETDPEVVRVTVRRVVSVSMPVQVQVAGVELVDAPTVEPKRVDVTLPATLASLAADLALQVSLTESDLAGLIPGEPRTVQGQIQLPEPLRGQGIELPVRTAAVSLVIRKQTRSLTLTNVPIHINVPPLLLDRYRIRLPEDQLVLRDVKLTGPADDITAIESKRVRVWAELRPTADELDSGLDQAPLVMHLPAGVRPETPVPRVTIIVERID